MGENNSEKDEYEILSSSYLSDEQIGEKGRYSIQVIMFSEST